jgi:hypothetical protein
MWTKSCVRPSLMTVWNLSTWWALSIELTMGIGGKMCKTVQTLTIRCMSLHWQTILWFCMMVFCRRRTACHQNVIAELVEDLIQKLSDGNVSWWQSPLFLACHFPTRITLLYLQARVPAIRDLVAKLSRFDHSLVPILGMRVHSKLRWSKMFAHFVTPQPQLQFI